MAPPGKNTDIYQLATENIYCSSVSRQFCSPKCSQGKRKENSFSLNLTGTFVGMRSIFLTADHFLNTRDVGRYSSRAWTTAPLLPIRTAGVVDLLQQAIKACSTLHLVWKFFQNSSLAPALLLSQTFYQSAIVFRYFAHIIKIKT